MVLVNCLNFPDGLSGGPYAAAKGGPILLTAQAALSRGHRRSYLEAERRHDLTQGTCSAAR